MGEVNRFFYPQFTGGIGGLNSPALNETDPPRRVGMSAGESVVRKMRNLQERQVTQ